MNESRFDKSMLLDFYGELLTDKQREYYDLHYNEDLSLAEIAEQNGITRQGAWDNIRRAESVMKDIEEKTGLIRRFSETQAALGGLKSRLARLREISTGEAAELADGIMLEVEALISRG